MWKDIQREDVDIIQRMQVGRNSPVYNGGNCFLQLWIIQLTIFTNGLLKLDIKLCTDLYQMN